MGEVFSASLNGKGIRKIVPRGVVNTPKQLTVEPISKKLYFCDREGMKVTCCNYDGSDLEVLINNGDSTTNGPVDQMKWCVGIAVSPKLGKFYWTQKGPSKAGQGRIFCASLNEPTRDRKDIQLVIDKLPEPVDLEIDESTNTLYWTDRGELPIGKTLNQASLDPLTGLLVHTNSTMPYRILASHLNEAIGLKLDNEAGHIYVTDLGGSLYRFNKDGSGKQRVYWSDQRALSGITIL